MIEFESWPKTPRLNREIIVTEKIDGTNSAVIIEFIEDQVQEDAAREAGFQVVEHETMVFAVGAQSRNRLIFPGKTTDNYGFAGWVQDHAEILVAALGAGRHFGEWWGKGVARNYGMEEKHFSLFNTERHKRFHLLGRGINLDVVPVLYQGTFDQREINDALSVLRGTGSVASWGAEGSLFDRPEGVVVYHTAARQTFKVLLENDELPKGVCK